MPPAVFAEILANMNLRMPDKDDDYGDLYDTWKAF